MTQEQIDAMVQASAFLVNNPLSWNDLPDDAKSLFLVLMPNPSFSEIQRFYLSLWWFPVDNNLLEELNTLCPPNTLISGRDDGNGQLYICADLLTDAINGGRLSPLLNILKNLPLTYKTSEMWPQPPDEE